MSELELKQKQLNLMKEKLRLRHGLPFKYGYNLYPWQKDYQDAKFESERLLCAANQIGKSTTQINDEIEIATNPELWPLLWPDQFSVNENTIPYSWYLYPNQDTVMSEFKEKWEPYCLPNNEYKDHPVYGWKTNITNKVLKSIQFNTGYTIYFKTYNQNVKDLQSGTVFRINCDEELPENILPELQARLLATNGQFSMVFTATTGQELWRRAVEAIGDPEEFWPHAWKRQITMYDCMEHIDGKKSVWTQERIDKSKSRCKSQAEVLRRIYGRFVRDEGLKYTGFSRERNYKPFPKLPNGKPFKGVPRGWSVYSGVDIGSGGDSGHPSAYSFLMVSEDYKKIRWFRGRRLDKIITTAGDTYQYYKATRGKLDTVCQSYDWASADFKNIAGQHETWTKAEKNHAIGEMALNTAFKTGTLIIYYDADDPDDESIKLVNELESLGENANKKTAKDDFIDGTRYAITAIPIDWEEVLNGAAPQKPDREKTAEERGRPDDYWENDKDRLEHQTSIEAEIEEFNDLF